uniref:Uncharacterized protein n=1 Tax=Leclercia adecarboxylata TaxID=83655 RepID=A0A6H1PS24_9ENTR|nr:hypothetical protein [Leclercia adecarboxylata]
MGAVLRVSGRTRPVTGDTPPYDQRPAELHNPRITQATYMSIWESAHLAGRRCRVGIGPCSPGAAGMGITPCLPGAAGMGITPCLPGADFEYALWICPYISRHLLSLNAQNFSIPKLTPT